MMQLTDIQTAVRLREVFTSIAESVVDRMRPAERIGKVYSYNAGNRTAEILFAGETIENLLTVHVAPNRIPGQLMITTFDTNGYNAPADIVRIAGRPGSYYITDFISGSPSSLNAVTINASSAMSAPNVYASGTLNAEGKRIYASPVLGFTGAQWLPQVGDFGAIRTTIYYVQGIAVPAGVRSALISINGSVHPPGNAAGWWYPKTSLNGGTFTADGVYGYHFMHSYSSDSAAPICTSWEVNLSPGNTLGIAVNAEADPNGNGWFTHPGGYLITWKG